MGDPNVALRDARLELQHRLQRGCALLGQAHRPGMLPPNVRSQRGFGGLEEHQGPWEVAGIARAPCCIQIEVAPLQPVGVTLR